MSQSKLYPLKKTTLLLASLISLFMLSCKNDKVEKKETINTVFRINLKGDLNSVSANTITLQSIENELSKTLLTATKEGENYILNSDKKLAYDQYFIQIGNKEIQIPVLIDNTDITVNYNPANPNLSTVIGTSEDQKKYNTYLKGKTNTKDLFFFQKKLIEENLDSQLSAVVLKDILGPSKWRLGQVKSLFEQLSETNKSSDIGNYIKTYIVTRTIEIEQNPNEQKVSEAVDPMPEGLVEIIKETPKEEMLKVVTPTKPKASEYAPFFYTNNLDGVEVGLKDILNKNKIVFIDFWASWCMPCRAKHPDYTILYNKYKSKGFEIVSVSQDQTLANCQNAVNQDNMTWINLMDNHARIANMYNVNEIPDSYLVDSHGGVIAKDIGPDRLEFYLKQEFGY